ncbi:MAG: acetyl-CoA carboxylase carboxyltransferase subunit alpha [Deltaproteobacteria bacterium]|nr:acetyl-CoA carboxylase carboxyltransferase subunit alpha [Deltaproteobacteria bacterium]
MFVLEFEKPILALKSKIEELKRLQEDEKIVLTEEIKKLEKKSKELEITTCSNLSSWEKTQLSRHPLRPFSLDFIEKCTEGFIELHGDRQFRDDPSIVGGFCKIEGISFLVVGHQKGRNTTENLKRNFGMPHPEGYRKALRLMKLANKFRIPILTLIDTAGAYPGIGAEERGQSDAIAVNLREMAGFAVPIICIIMGEGGSGGALALGVGNRVLMFEHSIYSVITPEGCASILWRDGSMAREASKNLKYTAQDLLGFKIIDQIIPEPLGGSHNDPQKALYSMKEIILSNYKELAKLSGTELIEARYQKFRQIGEFVEAS